MASKQGGAGCLVIFGLIFALAGSFPGFIALNDLRRARAMRSWPQTAATIRQVLLEHGKDTDAVVCTYSYRAPDPTALEAGRQREYDGDRVGVHSGSDNIGDWQIDTFNRLDAAAKSGRKVPCWYDPADPATAVLDREIRWSMFGLMAIFPLVFGLIGGAVAWAGFRQLRPVRKTAAESSTLILADRRGGGVLWVMALVWNAIAWAAMIGILSKPDVPWPVYLLVGLFPFIGLTLVWVAVQGTLRNLRHGRAGLRLDAGTWMTGRRVQVTVLTRTHPQPGDSIEARLAVSRRLRSAGEDSTTSNQVVWSLDLTTETLAGCSEGGLWAHRLELPLPSDVDPPSDDVAWRLEWQVVRPGPDLSAVFILPVVAGSDGAVLRGTDLRLAADQAAPLAVLRRAGVSVVREGGETVIRLPAWRNPSLYLSGLVACLLFSAGAVAAWQWIGWWTALLSLPILLPSWRGALRSALWQSEITLGHGRIVVAAGWWALQRHDLKAATVQSVERTSSMSSGDTVWCNMWLKTDDGQRIAIVRAVPGPAALRIAGMIDDARV